MQPVQNEYFVILSHGSLRYMSLNLFWHGIALMASYLHAIQVLVTNQWSCA